MWPGHTRVQAQFSNGVEASVRYDEPTRAFIGTGSETHGTPPCTRRFDARVEPADGRRVLWSISNDDGRCGTVVKQSDVKTCVPR